MPAFLSCSFTTKSPSDAHIGGSSTSENESSLTEHTQSSTHAVKMSLDIAPGEASGRAPCLQLPELALAEEVFPQSTPDPRG